MFTKRESIPDYRNQIENINLIIGTNTVNIGELRQRLLFLEKEFDLYREGVNSRFNKFNNLINEKLDSQKEDVESILIGLSKTFENKLNSISNGSSTVTDLLRKVAILEAIKDSVEHRRSTEEILKKIDSLNKESIGIDVNTKEGISIEAENINKKILILKWALGEEVDL